MSSPDQPPTVALERAMLEAILAGNADAWQSASSSLEGERAFRVLGIATSAAIFRRWPDDPPLQEVSDYVSNMVARIPGELLPVAPAVIEAVIRGSLGEKELLIGLPPKEIVYAELLIIQSIQKEVLTGSSDRESYLAEVLAAAD
jgi:hypothetical protein